MKLILQIALGVSLGIVLGGSLLYLVTGGFTNAVLNQAVIQNTPVAAKVEMPPKVVDNLSAANIPVTPTQAVVPTPIEPTTPQQISQTSETKGIAEIKVAGQSIVKSPSNAEQEEQKQKEAKFKSFYKKSDKCQAPDHYSHDALVGCGNEYIRARAKFEELWQQGKFKDQ